MLQIPEKLLKELKKEEDTAQQLASRSDQIHTERQIAMIQGNPHWILDVGCGRGLKTYFLSQVFKTSAIIGIDLKKENSWEPISKHTKNIAFFSFDGKHFNPYNNQMDVVIAWGVLEHVGENSIDELEWLRECKRVLKEDGKLYIFNLPRTWSWKEIISNLFGKGHQRRFTKKEIVDLLEQAGFNTKFIRSYGFLPCGQGMVSWLSSILNLFSFVASLESWIELPFSQEFDIVAVISPKN